jgi:hypothetical protein
MGSHEIRHAFFSQKQKESILAKKLLNLEIKHTNIYLTTDGREVEVTEVCKDPDSYNKNSFPDFVYLGQVTKWVRIKYD